MRFPLALAAAGLLALALAPLAPAAGAATPGLAGTCIPTSGGMDYLSYLCVDPKDPKCAVYTLTTTDWGVRKRCYGVL